jgi:hypothetical protein
VASEIVPVDPAQRVVVTISVVIALLRPSQFITAENHRNASRQQQQRDQVFHLSLSELAYL